MTEAIIFDCFGVLTTDGWLPFKQKYFGADPDLMRQATDLNKQVDAGLSDYGDFIQGVAELAGVSAAEAHAQIEDNVADANLFDYIRQYLKPHYKIGLLSNAGANWLDTLFEPAQVALFDAVSLSSETGFVKPDERAYKDIATKLGVAPKACMFLDDQERYCQAAKEVGMHAITYKSFDQAKAELTEALK